MNTTSFPVAFSDRPLSFNLKMGNRHGLVAGATGTGKTVTLRVLAEQFSAQGVPVFMADVKGDLSGLALTGAQNSNLEQRAQDLKMEAYTYSDRSVTFWDVFGKQGHPIRTTVSEMGPLLFARLLNLNDTQSAVLSLAFKIADDNSLLLLDIKDLQAMLQYLSEHAAELKSKYGNVSPASIGAIQRGLITLAEQGAERFFGEPALNIEDLIQTDAKGRGVINILAADKLLQNPRVYATLLLWLLSELFERLPEVGDQPKPKLVFFFDEAHLLFDDTPKVLLDKIEQVVRLVRSKGVGVYFVTQNPLDLPESVLGQLGNRVQHALRAFTPKDQKSVKVAAETFRPNPKVDVAQVITELAVGEALISFLDDAGTPQPVERARIYPPETRLLPLGDAERSAVISKSIVAGVYEELVDRESAYEILKQRAETMQASSQQTSASTALGKGASSLFSAFATSAVRSMANTIGRELMRGIMGSLSGQKRSKRY